MKIVFLVSRRSDHSVAQYREYSSNVHAPLVLALPGLRRYVINYARPSADGGPPVHGVLVKLGVDQVEPHAA